MIMKDYKIVSKKEKLFDYLALNELESAVKNLVAEGWEPVGGVSLVFDQISNTYTASQAMIKK